MNTIKTLRLRATALLRRCLWPLVRRWTIVEVTRGGTYYRLRTDGKVWELQAIGGMGDRKWHPIDEFPASPLWRGEAAIFWEAIEHARARGQTPLPPNTETSQPEDRPMNDTNSTGQPAALPGLAEATGSGCSFLLDCKGREICVGDVIRVKHYATRHGRGYRQHWMYKLVIEKLALGTERKADFLKVLSLQDPAKKPHSYYEQLTGQLRDDIEIVDGITEDADGRLMTFDERPRRRPNVGDVARPAANKNQSP